MPDEDVSRREATTNSAISYWMAKTSSVAVETLRPTMKAGGGFNQLYRTRKQSSIFRTLPSRQSAAAKMLAGRRDVGRRWANEKTAVRKPHEGHNLREGI